MKTRQSVYALVMSALFSCLWSLPAHSALFTYDGIIEDCGGLCGVFTTVGERFEASFEAPGGAGLVDYTQITNANISFSTPSGGALNFVSGEGTASTLVIDEFNNVIGGSVTIIATGATCGIVTSATLNFSSNNWETGVYNPSCGKIEPIAHGSGAFTSNDPSLVPLPSAIWLFMGSIGALLTLKKKSGALIRLG